MTSKIPGIVVDVWYTVQYLDPETGEWLHVGGTEGKFRTVAEANEFMSGKHEPGEQCRIVCYQTIAAEVLRFS